MTCNDNPGEGHGWNLIGNPYQSSVEWTTNWPSVNVDATIYVWDGVQYLTWNRNTLVGTKGSGVIPVSQGFYVKANATGAALTVPASERLHSNEGFYKAPDGIYRLTAEGNGYSDQTIIHFADGSTNAFDSQFDAYKIPGLAEAPQLYSLAGQTHLTVNCMPVQGGNTTVDVGFESGAAGLYTITLVEDISTLNNSNLYLEDLKDQKAVNLSADKSYSFMSDPQDDPLRFRVRFSYEKTPAAELPGPGDEVQVFAAGGRIVLNPDSKGEVYIYSPLGQLICHDIIDGTAREVEVDENGLYIVRFISQQGASVTKMLVK